jgi:tetratricopeptide (TPR) repeat protein
VLRLDPGRLGALNNLGNVLQSLGRLTEAENCYRDLLVREPQAPEALYNLGATLRKLGREDEARARDEELLAVLLAIADAAARDGSHAEAIDYYQRALELRPGDAAISSQLKAILDAQARAGQ